MDACGNITDKFDISDFQIIQWNLKMGIIKFLNTSAYITTL